MVARTQRRTAAAASTTRKPAAKPAAKPKASAKPAPLKGKAYRSAGEKGTIYDARRYVEEKVLPKQTDALKVFHHAYDRWGKVGQDQWISTNKSGGNFGEGFYTSTKPELGYGQYEFDVTIPLSALEGKKILEVTDWILPDNFRMPRGVSVLAVKQYDHTWFVFKPRSEDWLNTVTTERRWDRAGERPGT
ncbi:MAG: hypothetical protein K1X89_23225 [Myxococcaceae bacterium]|nr:hypothetical protein [Myxococcaceae bacterium]